MCVHTYYTGFLLYLQYDTQRFIALKCKHFENTPQVDLGACEHQSSGLYSVTAFR